MGGGGDVTPRDWITMDEPSVAFVAVSGNREREGKKTSPRCEGGK